MIERDQIFINGSWVPSTTTERLAVINPVTEEPVATIPAGTPEDVDAAAQRVTAGGGQVLAGPLETGSGSWVLQCADPQGAPFALEGPRKNRLLGYFERAPQTPGGRARRWSW